MDITEFYRQIGGDASVVVRRMGLTEAHLKKYLGKFQNNEDYGKLKKAVGEKDYYNAEWAAHTLKGVASNLGLDILYKDFQKIVDSIRAGKPEDVPALFDEAAADYEKIMELLTQADLS